MQQLWHMSFPYWHFIIRAFVVYSSVLIFLRLGGKREIGQMGAGEFVAILLISNAVQNSMNGGDNSITGGLILSSVIISLSILVAYLTFRSKKFENLIQGTPTLLIHNGRVIEGNLAKELLSRDDLMVKLRRQGVHRIDEVTEAILESDGYISITTKADVEQRRNDDENGAGKAP